MFTGLVETTGVLRAITPRGPGYRLSVDCDLGALELGESIAVSGACLTVAAIGPGGFEADISLETAQKTTLGTLSRGAALNLERSVRVGDRLGGHLVTGHVDGVATVGEVARVGEAVRVGVDCPAPLAPFIAAKGSVALDGVSLTVNALRSGGFEVMLIPHTQEITNLGAVRPGLQMNLEVDLLARYVVRYLSASSADSDLKAALERAGML